MDLLLLSELHKRLQWPKPDHVVQPPGAGPAVYSRLAHIKIEKPLARKLGNDQVRVNILLGIRSMIAPMLPLHYSVNSPKR